MSATFNVFDSIPDDLATLVGDGLSAFNTVAVGTSDWRDLAVSISSDDGCLGGLVGYTAWDWLFVKWLWIVDSARGQGLAAAAMVEAEKVAIRRGCRAAWIDTFNPAAKRLYESAGFTVFGELPDFPIGHTRYFLQKRFAPTTVSVANQTDAAK
ncbi:MULTISPECIES: GNAT family N-acetyltransferase [Paraburkholderia]|uniref:GNAT family N-acetyltransferase n=1 Tax=Paraburkholderia TaxID=1822464 RepID=UPI000B847AC4|nr:MULTISPECIES: GNAT family N-acetyltransferase [Paraburkholderia]MBK3822639.1 GNAT family N-acetyltransferase [Paraburkholderia aspalathi]MBK3834497.1 GNAT family N-acetyltransferase [Paraburkholderia aspalathi]MBK3843188.1 GNAT family N-acetyltransferase [Paraburkholderia aspalathi]MBK3864222.1 GNAT family N-acetyltransferase [Paraburkholderia aspalathi]MCX4139553.1 GNAT family N-acetyltransferase [Paraburkholderia aspalathi]